ncbi:three-Cys-motif partner protein TcmP [Chlorobaculum limnaeum]|uniref:three-Cys-motif partner protein TcmP n=1 Tax=Chlorobaculum limnaeum TaxID=274537 RepID=UPI000A980E24|nr:three-Cys-motif partner protein TcmP [Chlorobaculum limnaeum]
MGLNNPYVLEHMEALFGKGRAEQISASVLNKRPVQREQIIVEELCQSLKRYGSRYVLPFGFKNENGKRTSHHLIFVSKHFRGYEIMKEIMAKESSNNNQGVPSLEYNPADFLPQQSLLAQLYRPFEDLSEEILGAFQGKSLTLEDIYHTHSVDKPYIRKNYKDVMSSLFEDGLIDAVSPNGKPPRKGTFSDKTIATIPNKNDK